MSRIIAASVAAILALVLMFAASTVLIVDQRTYAVVSARGKAPPRFIVTPGLHFRWPPPFAWVLRLDRRIQALGRSDALRIRCADQKEISIRWSIQWRVANPRLYFNHFGNTLKRAESHLSKQADASARTFAARRSAAQVIAETRPIGRAIRERVAATASRLGIDIIDARVITLNLDVKDTAPLPLRMEAQYQHVADRLHSDSALEIAEIRAAAERARETHIAQAYRQAQALKGEGDAQAALIYADAYGRDPNFYRFYKSLEVYRKSFGARDVIVIDPSSDILRFMRSPNGANR